MVEDKVCGYEVRGHKVDAQKTLRHSENGLASVEQGQHVGGGCIVRQPANLQR